MSCCFILFLPNRELKSYQRSFGIASFVQVWLVLMFCILVLAPLMGGKSVSIFHVSIHEICQ